MNQVRQRWLMLLLCLLLGLSVACGNAPRAAVVPTATAILSPAAKILQQAQQAALHDATFTITFTIAGVSNQGTGTLVTQGRTFELQLPEGTAAGQPVGLTVIGTGLGDATLLYVKLSTNTLWSTLNDGEDGYYVNYDTDILNYDELSNATLIGAATMNGQSTWHLHATATTQMYAEDGTLITVSGGEDLWLRQKDAFPVQVQKNLSGTGTAGDGTTANLQLQATYHFLTWNTGAAITLPDPSQIAASG